MPFLPLFDGTPVAAAFVRNHTAGTETALNATVAATVVTADVATGNTLVAWVGFNNATSTTPIVNGLSKPAGETNSWAQIASHDSSNASAGAGDRGEMWVINTTMAWPVATVVTATLSVNVTAKVCLLSEFSGATVAVRGTAGTGVSTAGAPSAASSGTALETGDVVLGGATFEGTGTAITGDSDTTNGSWSAAYEVTTGTTTGHIAAVMQHKVVTATGVQTYNPTGSADSGAAIVALVPASGAVNGVAAGSGRSTASAVVGNTNNATAAASGRSSGAASASQDIAAVASGSGRSHATAVDAASPIAATASGSGTSTVSAAATVVVNATATGSGVSTASAVVARTVTAVAAAAGVSTARAVVNTKPTYSDDGYNYNGVARVYYDPPVVEPTASLAAARVEVRRVHVTMPTPTLVDGRPT